MVKALTSSACVAAFLLSCGPAVQSKKEDPKSTTSTPVAGAACTKDTECIDTEKCNTTKSVCEPKGSGSCTADKDCATGQLCDTDKGTCAASCADDSDCTAPLKCVDKNDKQYCGTKTAECEEDSDCGGNKICTDEGTCKTPRCPGDHCPTGYACFQNACVQQQNNNACHTPADCNALATCKTDKCDCTANKCVPKQMQTVCTPQNEATVCGAGNFCDNGTCKPLTSKNCTMDADCPTLFYCPPSQVPGTPATCVPGCKNNSECTNGDVCDTNNTHQCVPPSQVQGPECTSDQDCAPACVNGDASELVCHFSLTDTLGGKKGQCKPRCMSGFSWVGPGVPGITCPTATQTCVSVNTIEVSPEKTGENCGTSPLNGYSYCL